MKKFLTANRDYQPFLRSLILWKVLILVVAFASIQIFPFKASFPYAETTLQPYGYQLLWSWGNFDGVHYLSIAKNGYENQFTQAFFPVYPLLIKGLAVFVKDYLFSALLISHISFVAGVIVFFRLARLDLGGKESYWSLVFLLLFPTSMFFGAVYTESLFFLFLILSFYFMRRGNWVKSSLFAALASGTRFVGIFIFPALIWEYYRANKSRKWRVTDVASIFLSTSGFLAYIFYLKLNFGAFSYFVTSQNIAWQREGFVILPQVLFRYIKIFVSTPPISDAFLIALNEFLLTTFVLLALVLSFKKVRFSYLLFSFPAILTPTLTGTLSSMPRYALAAFPIFIYLGMVKNKYLRYTIVIAFVLASIVTIARFTTGRWVS